MVVELVMLMVLIGLMIKLCWKLLLQVCGSGVICIIVIDYYVLEIEGVFVCICVWVSFDVVCLDDWFVFQQIGDGYFVVLIDQGEGNMFYQGLMFLVGGLLVLCVQNYFV